MLISPSPFPSALSPVVRPAEHSSGIRCMEEKLAPYVKYRRLLSLQSELLFWYCSRGSAASESEAKHMLRCWKPNLILQERSLGDYFHMKHFQQVLYLDRRVSNVEERLVTLDFLLLLSLFFLMPVSPDSLFVKLCDLNRLNFSTASC